MVLHPEDHIPTGPQGNKADPTGRSIDDLLRSFIPGALPQSGAVLGDGTPALQTGIQSGAPPLGSPAPTLPLPSVSPLPQLESPTSKVGQAPPSVRGLAEGEDFNPTDVSAQTRPPQLMSMEEMIRLIAGEQGPVSPPPTGGFNQALLDFLKLLVGEQAVDPRPPAERIGPNPALQR